MYTNIHCSFILSNKKLKTTKMSLNGRIINRGIFNNKKKKTTDTVQCIVESQQYYIKQENQTLRVLISWSLYKVQGQARLSYGDKNKNNGYFWKKRMDMRVLFLTTIVYVFIWVFVTQLYTLVKTHYSCNTYTKRKKSKGLLKDF